MAKENKSNLFYLGLISLIWLITYISCTLLWEQKLGWDEVNYLGVARGIATDSDFSARFYTIMGIIKHGYPTHFINFPVFSGFLAIFLRAFGMDIHSAYFSTWFCAFGVCIFIYFIFNLLSENKKLSFFVSISYLFIPGMIKNCDTALMEQFGCFLLCFFIYFILKDFSKGNLTHMTALKFGLAFLVLWLYKSLYVGVFVGSLVIILLAYSQSFSGNSLRTKVSLPVFLFLSYGLFILVFYVLQKFVFLPVAPMMSFSFDKELNQIYADFLGGFLNEFPVSLGNNIYYFCKGIIAPYIVYPATFHEIHKSTYIHTGSFVLVWVYFFLFFVHFILTFASWKKLSLLEKLFVLFTIFTILSFNMIFNILFSTNHGNIWRYNMYTLPLYLCYLVTIGRASFEYKKVFLNDHPKVSKALTVLILLFIYFPLFLSKLSHDLVLEDSYHSVAHRNAQIVKNFIGASSPKFIYFNDGTHVTWDLYPTKQVMKDAKNEQLLQVNQILPEPIEFLFLRQKDWLFQINKDLILMAEPILDGKYLFYGFDKDSETVVYRFNRV